MVDRWKDWGVGMIDWGVGMIDWGVGMIDWGGSQNRV